MTQTDHDPLLTMLDRLDSPAPVRMRERIFTGWFSAPSVLGEVYAAVTDQGVQFLRSVESVDYDPAVFAALYRARFARPLRQQHHPPADLLPALRGNPDTPELELSTLSQFQRAVLCATRNIPAGETRPYSWIAREAGRPSAVRAAASTLARNPVPLLVPCHRVTRADGAVGQYLFDSATKQRMLRDEGADLDEIALLTARGVHYVGSDTTHVVCLPTCHHARRLSRRHRREFRTTAAATEAGYRPCHDCRPTIPVSESTAN